MADKGRINQVIYIMGLPSLNSLPSRLRYLPPPVTTPLFCLILQLGEEVSSGNRCPSRSCTDRL